MLLPFVRLVAVLAVVVGIAVLIGWILHNSYLTSVQPGLATMKPATALCFVLSGIALGLRSREPVGIRVRPGSEIFFLGVVIFLSGLSLFESQLGFDLHPMVPLWGGLSVTDTMSPATAFNFIFLALALLSLEVVTHRNFWPAQVFALAVVIISFIAFAGYIYGPHGLYHSLPYGSMALHTAILFILLGGATLCVRPDRGLVSVIVSPHAGGWLARRLLPITACLPFCLGWLRTHGENHGIYNRELGLAIFATTNICIMSTLVWFSARALNRSDEERLRSAQDLQKANEQLQLEILGRQQAQDLLRQANEGLELKVAERTGKLQIANKELEAFSYSVSHDLRAPLRAINGYSRLLQESTQTKLDEQENNFLNRVCVNGDRMSTLIDAMLKLSRLSRGEMTISSVNLSQLARATSEEMASRSPERTVQFTAEPDLEVQGDETLLRIVLENLIGNAWKFTGKTKDAVIAFGRRKVDGKDAYFVSDNGAGFNMAYAGKLFGAFQRLHAVEDFEGSGVGLTTVERIIHRHGGIVWAEGEVDKGASFYFTLPETYEENGVSLGEGSALPNPSS